MKLIFILGSQAVGKMTVGQELVKITNLKLMHNHMMIEPVIDIFGGFDVNTVLELRNVIFENFLKTNNYGLIFTMCMDFDSQFNWDYVNDIVEMYKNGGAEIYFVELRAPLDIRLERNKTENRLLHKKSKRDLEMSEYRLQTEPFKHRFESNEGEIPWDNYLIIDNTNIGAIECASKIKEHFNL